MNILLINPEFPSNFWSFDPVLKLLGKRAHSPPLGLLTIAALLPGEWKIRLVDEPIRRASSEDWDWCDAVFIGGMQPQCKGIIRNSKEGRSRGKQVVVGGAWVFHSPEEAFEAGADIVVIGEAETAVPQLVEALKAETSGLTIGDHVQPKMEESPLPRFDLVEMDQYLLMPVQTTRGCPFLCEFCDVTLMNGRNARTKTPEQVIRELEHLYDLGWRRDVFVVDDNFNANAVEAKKLLKAIIPFQEAKQYPFGFITQCSVTLAQKADLLEMMVKAGFFRVFLGIESTESETHELSKKVQNERADLDEVCRTINEAGLNVIAGCIIGYDGESAGADQRFIDFANRNRIGDLFLTICQAPPGTDLWKRLEREGRPPWKSLNELQAGSSGLMNFDPTRPIEEIAAEFIRTFQVLYTPEAYWKRVYEQFRGMRPLPFKKPRRKPTWGEIRAVLSVIWHRGVLGSQRAAFWKYFRAGKRDFPDRMDRFIAQLIFFEHLEEYRETVAENVRLQLAEREDARTAWFQRPGATDTSETVQV
jgi:radical SAM superfamily enzyme YgiQ (UPF0313 family)